MPLCNIGLLSGLNCSLVYTSGTLERAISPPQPAPHRCPHPCARCATRSTLDKGETALGCHIVSHSMSTHDVMAHSMPHHCTSWHTLCHIIAHRTSWHTLCHIIASLQRAAPHRRTPPHTSDTIAPPQRPSFTAHIGHSEGCHALLSGTPLTTVRHTIDHCQAHQCIDASRNTLRIQWWGESCN
jgi:hypothetical protein